MQKAKTLFKVALILLIGFALFWQTAKIEEQRKQELKEIKAKNEALKNWYQNN